MHSDEAWLASLTRSQIVERSPTATEDFFRLTPRYPHAVKILFHAAQAPFVALRWSLPSVRALSLLAGAASLGLAWRVARRRLGSPVSRCLLVAALAVDAQMVCAMHFARQEILLVMVFLAALYLWEARPTGRGRALAMASILGLAIGIHPNSFVIALPYGLLHLSRIVAPGEGTRKTATRRSAALSEAVLFVAILSMFAGIFVGLSFLMDGEFLTHYRAFGTEVGVASRPLVKLLGLKGFYRRLWMRIPGTYYVPEMRLSLSLFAVALVLAGITLLTRRGKSRALVENGLLFIGVNLGLMVIGKYSQPSAALLLPPGWLLVSQVMDQWIAPLGSGRSADVRRSRDLRIATIAMVAIILGTLTVSSVHQALPWMSVSYRRYRERVESSVESEGRVLANLNTAFGLAPDRLRAWRDLAALETSELSFAEYVRREDIRTIVYPAEMDRIYAERPVWNALYGNLVPYYEEMKAFLTSDCDIVTGFDEPVFAMRMVAYTGQGAAPVTVYRVRVAR